MSNLNNLRRQMELYRDVSEVLNATIPCKLIESILYFVPDPNLEDLKTINELLPPNTEIRRWMEHMIQYFEED
jgi:hypothetical protein